MIFTSKNNKVELKDGKIHKTYIGDNVDEKIESEIKIFADLSREGIDTPAVLEVNPNSIVLEYIDGKTYLEVLEEHENIGKVDEKPWLNLYCWLKRFYEVTGASHPDLNLRNFILKDEKCYGIDFEANSLAKASKMGANKTEFSKGFTSDESLLPKGIGTLQAFICTYDPAASIVKKRICLILGSELAEEERSQCIAAFRNEIKKMIERRSNMPVTKEGADRFILEIFEEKEY